MNDSCFLVQGRLLVGQFWVPKKAFHVFVSEQVLTLWRSLERRHGRLTPRAVCRAVSVWVVMLTWHRTQMAQAEAPGLKSGKGCSGHRTDLRPRRALG